jgi:hypothetical protein
MHQPLAKLEWDRIRYLKHNFVDPDPDIDPYSSPPLLHFYIAAAACHSVFNLSRAGGARQEITKSHDSKASTIVAR